MLYKQASQTIIYWVFETKRSQLIITPLVLQEAIFE